jgi:DNA-binding NtrC family response regulator
MKPLKVLILDDEPIVGRQLKQTLSRYGLDVETFEKPDLAVARMEETRFDVVVSDIRMQGISGLQLLEFIRTKSARTKVIIITAYTSREVEREALAKGAFGYVTKPFKPRDLLQIINRAAQALGRTAAGSPIENEP